MAAECIAMMQSSTAKAPFDHSVNRPFNCGLLSSYHSSSLQGHAGNDCSLWSGCGDGAVADGETIAVAGLAIDAVGGFSVWVDVVAGVMVLSEVASAS
jgi:hypothetical protein